MLWIICPQMNIVFAGNKGANCVLELLQIDINFLCNYCLSELATVCASTRVDLLYFGYCLYLDIVCNSTREWIC